MIQPRKNRMREARFFTEKSQMRLFVETGIHYSTTSRLECGYLQPSEEQKVKLANALGVKKYWLFPEEDNK